MKRTIFVLMLALAVGFMGCSGNQAEELFETAKLEELQNNPGHAKELYEEIIEKYPQSEYAKKAKERLPALQDK